MGVVRLGGAETTQNIGQQATTFKNDFTYTDLQWLGGHVLKAGLRFSRVEYDVFKSQNGNPLFRYLPEISFQFPGKRCSAPAIPISPATPRSTVCICRTTGSSRRNSR